ncbi:MAG: DUF494 family protein [Neisseriaceae bacterium]|nr:MAG: DUF494 family protein [Neisseriaceae bacterium]
MFDVLVFLFEQCQSLGHLPSRYYITEKLGEAGFEYADIVDALICFDELCNFKTPHKELGFPQLESRMRFFSPEEIKSLPLEVRGYIHFLYREKVIEFSEIEILIHAIMKVDSNKIDIETVKVITLIAAWMNQSEMPVLIGDDLLSTLYVKNLAH